MYRRRLFRLKYALGITLWVTFCCFILNQTYNRDLLHSISVRYLRHLIQQGKSNQIANDYLMHNKSSRGFFGYRYSKISEDKGNKPKEFEKRSKIFLHKYPKGNLNKQNNDFTGFYYNASQDTLNDSLLHHHKFTYLINEENLCRHDDILVFAYVHSAPKKKQERDDIRNTWGSVKSVNNSVFVLVFAIGETNDAKIQKEIEEESKAHHDVIQGNFVDHYRNLTYKHVMGLHWIQTYCNHTKFILKSDDDVIVDPYHLSAFLLDKLKRKENKEFLYCSVYINQGPVRYKGDKWFMTESEYPHKKYPNYCEGFVYIMSPDVSLALLEASTFVPFFWVDDVYVTGFLAYISGIRHTFFTRDHAYRLMKSTYVDDEVLKTMFFLKKYHSRNHVWSNTWKLIIENLNKHQGS